LDDPEGLGDPQKITYFFDNVFMIGVRTVFVSVEVSGRFAFKVLHSLAGILAGETLSHCRNSLVKRTVNGFPRLTCVHWNDCLKRKYKRGKVFVPSRLSQLLINRQELVVRHK
jgi:hypothetical protein